MRVVRRARARARGVFAVVVAAAFVFGLLGTAAAKDKRDLTVMTRNLYIGADVARVLEVVGATPFQGTAPFWASDHAGVVATVRLH